MIRRARRAAVFIVSSALALGLHFWWASRPPVRDPDAIYIRTQPSGATVTCYDSGDPVRGIRPDPRHPVGHTPGPLHVAPRLFPGSSRPTLPTLRFELWGYASVVRDFNAGEFEGPGGTPGLAAIALTPRLPLIVPLLYALRDGPLVALGLILLMAGGLDAFRSLRSYHEARQNRMRLEIGDIAPGLELGGYVLGTLLGKGGQARVYEGHRADTEGQHRGPGRQDPLGNAGGEVVAIKILSTRNARDNPHFDHEVRAWRALSHPNIVHLLDWGEVAGRLYLVMERVEGETLAQRIARGPLSADELETLARQLLEALSYAHARGIVHRDVKPSNLIITARGRLILMDFGIALHPDLPRTTQVGTVVGTLEYLSPEAIRGETVDWRSDLYAAGLTLYHAAAGYHPFTPLGGGVTRPELLQRQLKQQPVALHSVRPDLPPAFCDVVDRLVSKEPAARVPVESGIRST